MLAARISIGVLLLIGGAPHVAETACFYTGEGNVWETRVLRQESLQDRLGDVVGTPAGLSDARITREHAERVIADGKGAVVILEASRQSAITRDQASPWRPPGTSAVRVWWPDAMPLPQPSVATVFYTEPDRCDTYPPSSVPCLFKLPVAKAIPPRVSEALAAAGVELPEQ